MCKDPVGDFVRRVEALLNKTTDKKIPKGRGTRFRGERTLVKMSRHKTLVPGRASGGGAHLLEEKLDLHRVALGEGEPRPPGMPFSEGTRTWKNLSLGRWL